jgi:hypothetical protein
MRIAIQTKPNVRWEFDFGWETSMWSSMYWFTLIKATFDKDEDEAMYYKPIFSFGVHPKYWKRSTLNTVVAIGLVALTFGYMGLIMFLLKYCLLGFYLLVGVLVFTSIYALSTEYKKNI